MKTNLGTIDSLPNLDDTATALTRQRYQRITGIYGHIVLLEHVRIDRPIIGTLNGCSSTAHRETERGQH